MRTTARRNTAKIFATVALVAGAAAVAGIGTYGAYTDTTTADVSVGSAKVSVLMNDSDQGIHVDAKGMVPGDKVVFPVSVKRAAGSAELGDLTLQTTVTNQNALTDALRLTVDSCSKAWTVSGSSVTCSGTTTNVSTDGGLVGNGATSAWGETASWVPEPQQLRPGLPAGDPDAAQQRGQQHGRAHHRHHLDADRHPADRQDDRGDAVSAKRIASGC